MTRQRPLDRYQPYKPAVRPLKAPNRRLATDSVRPSTPRWASCPTSLRHGRTRRRPTGETGHERTGDAVTAHQDNLTVLTEHIRRLATDQQAAAGRITLANQSARDIAANLWSTHGAVCAATN